MAQNAHAQSGDTVYLVCGIGIAAGVAVCYALIPVVANVFAVP